MNSFDDLLNVLSFAEQFTRLDPEIKHRFPSFYTNHVTQAAIIQKHTCQILLDSLIELLCIHGRCSTADFDLPFDEEIVVGPDGSCDAIDYLLLKGATFKKEIIDSLLERDVAISSALIARYNEK